MDDIRIRVGAQVDPSLDTAANKLHGLGAISDENKKKFTEAGAAHSKALKETGSEVDRVEGKMRNLAERITAVFAVERIIEFAEESVKAFAEAGKGANQLEFAITKINGQGKGAFLKLTTQAEELSRALKGMFTPAQIVSAQKQLANFGLTSKQIQSLIPQVLDMASATGKALPEAIEKSILAINGQTKGLRDVGVNFKSTGDAAKNLGLLQKDLAKFTGEAASQMDTEAGKLQRLGNYWDIFKESVGQYLSDYATELVDNFQVLFGNKSVLELGLEKSARMINKFNDERLKVAEKADKVQLAAIKAQASKEIYELQKQSNSGEIAKRKIISKELELAKQYYAALEKITTEGEDKMRVKIEGKEKEDKTKEHLKRLLDLYDKFNDDIKQADIDGTKDETQKKIKELDLKFQKEKEQLEKERRELIELTHDKNASVRAAALEDLTLLQATEEAQQEAHNNAMINLAIETADKLSKIEADAVAKQLKERLKAQKLDEDLFDVNTKSDLVRQELALSEKGKLTEEKQAEFDKKEIQRQLAVFEIKKSNLEAGSLEYRQIEEKELELRLELQKKADDKLKEQMQSTLENIKQIGDFAIQEYEQMLQSNIDYLDHKESLQKDAIAQEQQLAIAGKANDLSFEVKKQADLERQREADVKKLKRAKELEVFLNAIASFSKDDPKSAIAKALALVAVTKGAEAAFGEEGGILGKIKEKSWAGRKHTGGGDILLHAQTGEGLFSRKEVANMGGESAFMGFKHLLAHPLREKPIPMSGVMFQSGFNTKRLEDRIESLEKTMKNKKEVNVDFESMKDMLAMNISVTENGVTETIKHILNRKKI